MLRTSILAYTKLKLKMIPTIESLCKVFVQVQVDNFSIFLFPIFIIQTMCSIVAHENEFQPLFQKFAFATDIAIPI